MSSRLLKIIPYVLALIGLVILFTWVGHDAGRGMSERLAGQDSRVAQSETEPNEIKGTLISCGSRATNLPGSWPRFRGPDSTGFSVQDVQLATQWPQDGVKELWSVDVGEGYAGATILNGKVYMLDYDREGQADVVRCMSLGDGKDIWRYSYPVKVKRNHGMSRTVPAVTEKYVVTLGPKCHVTCLDAATGEFRWMINLVKKFNTTVPQWYAGQCPLIDNGKAIIAPGGDSLMIAVDCQSGEVVWKTPNPNGWKMTHSSVIPMEFQGKKMYVYCGSKGVAGISANDGSLLWETTDWKISIATVPSPVVVGDGLIFLSGGYNAGSMMLQLKMVNDKIAAETVFKLPAEVFGSPQQTPIFYNGYIYGVRPDGQMACLDLAGKVMWTSGSSEKFGLGPYIIINDLIYVMNDSGLLTLTKASPTGFTKLADAKVLDGPDSWGPMAVASGRLILRDINRMKCFDISNSR